MPCVRGYGPSPTGVRLSDLYPLRRDRPAPSRLACLAWPVPLRPSRFARPASPVPLRPSRFAPLASPVPLRPSRFARPAWPVPLGPSRLARPAWPVPPGLYPPLARPVPPGLYPPLARPTGPHPPLARPTGPHPPLARLSHLLPCGSVRSAHLSVFSYTLNVSRYPVGGYTGRWFADGRHPFKTVNKTDRAAFC
jgi:hypothetical protein